jgi:hypothetical protein
VCKSSKCREAVEKCSSAALRSVRVAATYEKAGLTPRYSRAWHLNIFEQPLKQGSGTGAILQIAPKYLVQAASLN